ncbi:BQ2448_3734 [Microbotryum intermedium]|uniref:BQ2448_3734 protein n=1 Tax=Microbotryum intermedium TaxID=269621 RepID=A0A238FAV4_9BASI|nr:BQ2448_3734 [Microbotryum intermedium]
MSCIRPATPGTVVVLAGTVLLALVSVSVPILKPFYFLKAEVASNEITLGVWGYCSGSNCTQPKLGYALDLAQVFGYSGVDGIALSESIPNALVKGLTYVLVLHPVAAVFGATSVLLGLLAHIRGFGGTCWTTFFASLGASTALLAFAIDLALFLIAKKRITSSSVGGAAELGAALWMTLAGGLLLMVSGCFFGCGGRMVNDRTSRREDSEKNRPGPDPAYGAHMRNSAYQQQQYNHQNGGNNLPKFAEIRNSEAIPLNQMGEKNDFDGDGDDVGYGRTPYRQELSGGAAVGGVGQGYGRRNDGPVMAGGVPTSPQRYNSPSAYPPPPTRQMASSPPPGQYGPTIEPFQSMSSSHGKLTKPPRFPSPTPQENFHPSQAPAANNFHGSRDIAYQPMASASPAPGQNQYQQHETYDQQALHQPAYGGNDGAAYNANATGSPHIALQHTGTAPSYNSYEPDYTPHMPQQQEQQLYNSQTQHQGYNDYAPQHSNQHQYNYDAPAQQGYDSTPQPQQHYHQGGHQYDPYQAQKQTRY